ncbi:hypothetical protein E5082_18445 [Streptomyces griseoluteus]|uniref:Bacterial Ig-like domain-containing protein n=1 Tax=Streptomyces griseoluteus TaxID=29306 RepID=A0A4Z1DHQ3_STRGP|nr:hypothetical protein [Streptomyces griseoluteus]TGN82395.1 hypothetical protein E5082_18445 [Streptomyces griseoluteus]GHF09788.1 hypothetical protein GCM10017776_29310 [Streptomyces griseoluteus]
MSEAPAKRRQVIKGIDASGPYPVEYRFAHAPNAERHLVIVLAGLDDPDGYGWATGEMDDLPANILWIRDRFDGGSASYLCRDMDFGVEKSVAEVVARVTELLGLHRAEVTLWGSGRGGSAALHLGLKHGYGNIVAVGPEFALGSPLRERRPAAARHLLGEPMADEDARALDALLPDLLASSVHPQTHLYVFPPADDEPDAGREMCLGLLRQYRNADLVHETFPLLNLAHMLVAGLVPRLTAAPRAEGRPSAGLPGIGSYLKSTSVVQGSFAAPVVLSPGPDDLLSATGVRLVGRAPGAVRVSLWENGTYLASAPVTQDGDWSWTRRTWTPGEHNVRLFAVDALGYQSPRADAQFTVSDHLTPEVVPTRPGAAPPVVQRPEPYLQVPGARVGFTGFATGAARVGIRENGAVLGECAVAPDGAWSWAPEGPWAGGPHTVEVFSIGAADTESRPVAVTFTAES